MGKLTEAQRYLLTLLDTRRASMSPSNVRPQHIAVLRRMEEAGLVARNPHGNWYIKDAGRAHLQKEP